MKLVVNIPAFNEEEKIGETIGRIPRLFEGVDEVVVQVVDDGSKDGTGKAAESAGVGLIRTHRTNRGIGKTFRTAVEFALENGADIMVNIDADGQLDPNDIGKLIEPILSGEADIVSADRFDHLKAKNIPFLKDVLNRVAAKIIGAFMNARIKDLTCGFRAYDRESLLRLNLPGAFTYTQEVIIDALGKDLKVRWVPVEVTYFAERKSRVVKSVYKYVNNSAKLILKAVRDVRPVKFFGAPGLFLIAIGFIGFIGFVVQYIVSGFKISPYLNYLVLGSITFIIGSQLLIFAFIADMIKSSRNLIEEQTYAIKKERYRK